MKMKRSINIIAFLALACILTGCGGRTPQTEHTPGDSSVEDTSVEDTSMEVSSIESRDPGKRQPDGTPAAGAAYDQNQPGAGGNQSETDAETAKNIALAHAGLAAGDVVFVKTELDYDDRMAEYELEFVTDTVKYEYEIKAEDGTVLKFSAEPIVQMPEHLQTQGLISAEAAKEAALNFAGASASDAVCTKLELEYDGGIAVYDIEFYIGGIEYSFEINAASGEVLEMER